MIPHWVGTFLDIMKYPLKIADMASAGYAMPFYEQNYMKVCPQCAKNRGSTSNCPTKSRRLAIGTPIANSCQRLSPTWFYRPLALLL